MISLHILVVVVPTTLHSVIATLAGTAYRA